MIKGSLRECSFVLKKAKYAKFCTWENVKAGCEKTCGFCEDGEDDEFDDDVLFDDDDSNDGNNDGNGKTENNDETENNNEVDTADVDQKDEDKTTSSPTVAPTIKPTSSPIKLENEI